MSLRSSFFLLQSLAGSATKLQWKKLNYCILVFDCSDDMWQKRCEWSKLDIKLDRTFRTWHKSLSVIKEKCDVKSSKTITFGKIKISEQREKSQTIWERRTLQRRKIIDTVYAHRSGRVTGSLHICPRHSFSELPSFSWILTRAPGEPSEDKLWSMPHN